MYIYIFYSKVNTYYTHVQLIAVCGRMGIYLIHQNRVLN